MSLAKREAPEHARGLLIARLLPGVVTAELAAILAFRDGLAILGAGTIAAVFAFAGAVDATDGTAAEAFHIGIPALAVALIFDAVRAVFAGDDHCADVRFGLGLTELFELSVSKNYEDVAIEAGDVVVVLRSGLICCAGTRVGGRVGAVEQGTGHRRLQEGVEWDCSKLYTFYA